MEVHIPRNRWLRGERGVLWSKDGCGCVVGHICLAYGIRKEDLVELGLPRGLDAAQQDMLPADLHPDRTKTRLSFTWHYQEFYPNTEGDLPHLLTSINDAPAQHLVGFLRELLNHGRQGLRGLVTGEELERWGYLLCEHREPEQLREAWLIEEAKAAGIKLIFEG